MVRTLQAAGKIRGIGARGVVALTAALGIGLSALPAAAAEPALQRQSPPNWIKASLWALDNSVPVVVFGARLNEDCSAPMSWVSGSIWRLPSLSCILGRQSSSRVATPAPGAPRSPAPCAPGCRCAEWRTPSSRNRAPTPPWRTLSTSPRCGLEPA